MANDTSIEKLTEREKECLRLWLEHKTAKQIALDLGVSHYAIEKRLKMARTKLGVDSSLEAARLLSEKEGSGQAVAGSPDLQPSAELRKSWRLQPLVIGGIAMFSAIILTLTMVASPQSVENGEIKIDGNLERVFRLLDADKSGYIEDPESPFVTVAFLDATDGDVKEGEAVIGNGNNPEHVAEFYSAADTNSDGRVSFGEYYSWSEARWAELGVEISTIVKVLPSPQS